MMTYEQWLVTKQFVSKEEIIRIIEQNDDADPDYLSGGVVYGDGYYIQIRPDGSYYLPLENFEHTNEDLSVLEYILYRWIYE